MKFLKNERGSAVFYAIGMLSVTALLLVLMANIIKVYAAKEQASTSAEQAVIAATDAVYGEVVDAIKDYDNSLPGSIHGLLEKKVWDDVEDETNLIQTQEPEFSFHQAQREAIDRVLSQELPQNQNLKSYIYNALQKAEDDVVAAVSELIVANGSDEDDTFITYFNDEERIKIQTEAEFKAMPFKQFFTNSSDEVPQEAVGSVISFVSETGWFDREIDINPLVTD